MPISGNVTGFLVPNAKEKDMPWTIVKKDGKHCVHKKNEDGTVGEKKKCYSGSDAEERAEKYLKALYANSGEQMQIQKDFMFTDLAGQGKDFDGMASGNFVDFRGTEVAIKSTDLSEIVRKTKLAIESTRTESGEVVGLPIDEDGHDHRGGAGWIVDVSLDRSGSKIRFTPKWTQIGIDLISKNIRRFFSVSVDLANKVIMGGSLTNWPATRDAKSGSILLRPIELSQQMYSLQKENGMADLQKMNRKQMESAIRKYAKDNPDDDKVNTDGLSEMSDEEVSKMYEACSGKEKKSDMSIMREGLTKIANTILNFVRGTPDGKEESDDEDDSDDSDEESDDEEVEELSQAQGVTNMANKNDQSNTTLTELLNTPEAIIELGKMAELKAQEFLLVERRKVAVVEFASTLCGGTKDKPFGLPIPASEVVELLLSLSPNQEAAVKNMLTKTLNAVNFTERGYEGEFLFGRPRLPVEYRQSLQTWVDSGKSVDSFFNVNVELGKATDFNLSEFTVAKV